MASSLLLLLLPSPSPSLPSSPHGIATALLSLPLPPPLPHSLGAPGLLGSGKKNSLPSKPKRALPVLSPEAEHPPASPLPARPRPSPPPPAHRRARDGGWDMDGGRFEGGYGRSCLWSALPPSLTLLLSLAGRQALACSSLLLPPSPRAQRSRRLLASSFPVRSLMAPLTSCWGSWPPGRRGDRFENGTVLAGKPAFAGPTPPPPFIPPSLARPLLFPQL